MSSETDNKEKILKTDRKSKRQKKKFKKLGGYTYRRLESDDLSDILNINEGNKGTMEQYILKSEKKIDKLFPS